jgi:purine-binding chemotaxis protein CheW
MNESKIDWNMIRQKLATAGAALESGFSPDPEERKKILRARAEVLARAHDEFEPEGFFEAVEFRLADETYAFASCYIREVYPIRDYTPLPGTPAFVLGLINVRGQIVSVIDIGKFFDLPQKGIGDLNKVIILRDDRMEFGVLADSITGVRNIQTNSLQPSLPTLTGIREEYLMGVTRDRTIVLDAEKLLGDRNIVVHEEI